MIFVEDLAVRAGDFSLEGISFQVPQGKYAVLMGKTGSGKTTIVECLCGLRSIESGQIILAENDVTFLKPAERGVGYVPQDGALFPTMTIREHLAFPLKIRKWKKQDIAQRSEELAQLLGIEELLDRPPQGLSGGEAQRVALGRALAFHPQILLLDEPLSALDDQTRYQMYELLKRVQRLTSVTTLHITHNREDAVHLADCFLLIENGSIMKIDEPKRKPKLEPNEKRDSA